jgi:hypothetical protein
MIYGHILASETFQFFQAHPVWKQAFDWLKTVIFYPLDGHRPKCSDTIHPKVLKLVIKVHISLMFATNEQL